MMSSLSRRLLLSGPAAVLLGAAGGPATAPARPPAHPPASPAVEPVDPGLNDRARRRGLFYGSAVDATQLTGDPAYMEHIPAECGLVVSEGAFKWADIRPSADKFTFDRAEALLAFAKRHGLRTRGHTLVWHEANPKWLEAMITPKNAEKLLTTHVTTVAAHFRRRLVHWDVVNEVINVQDKQPMGLRDSMWLRMLGPRFIDLAFHACAAADPTSLRCINETVIEYANPVQQARREALLKLCSDLKARGVPVQAVGIQAHLDAGELALDQKVIAKFVQDIASLGLKIIITELDVRDQSLPADIESRDQVVAEHARAWLEPVLENPNTLGVVTWGLSDRRTWLDQVFPRGDKLPQRPLPLDAKLQRKPLWASLGAAFDAAPGRVAL